MQNQDNKALTIHSDSEISSKDLELLKLCDQLNSQYKEYLEAIDISNKLLDLEYDDVENPNERNFNHPMGLTVL